MGERQLLIPRQGEDGSRLSRLPQGLCREQFLHLPFLGGESLWFSLLPNHRCGNKRHDPRMRVRHNSDPEHAVGQAPRHMHNTWEGAATALSPLWRRRDGDKLPGATTQTEISCFTMTPTSRATSCPNGESPGRAAADMQKT